MSFTLFSFAIIILFATVAAIEIYRGIKRGFFKTLVSLGTVSVSVLISVIISPLLSQLVMNFLSIRFVDAASESYEELARSLNLLINTVIAIVISSVLFVVLFFLVRMVLGPIMSAVLKRCAGKSSDSVYGKEKLSFIAKNDKILGAVTGAVSAIIITMVITSPLMGTLDVADKTLSSFSENKIKISNYVDSETVEAVKKYSDDLPGNIFYRCGGKLMYNCVSSAEIYGERVYLISEVEVLSDTIRDFSVFYEAMNDPREATKKHIRSIDSLCADIENLKLFKGVLACGLAEASDAWLNDEAYLEIKMPEINKLIDPAFDEVLTACKETERESMAANLTTLLKMYSIVLESKVVYLNTDDYDAVVNFLDESNIIDEMNSVIEENPYFDGVSVSSIAFTFVADRIKKENYDEEKYSELMVNIADALNNVNTRGYGSEDEKIEALTTSAIKHITEYGYDVPEEVAEQTAAELLKVFNEPGVTDADVREIFDKYSAE